MFFTIIAITLISLFIFAYATFSVVEDRSATNKRIESMNNFVFSAEDDLSRQLYISGARAMFLFEKRISEDGLYISNVSGRFSDLFFNANFYGEYQEIMSGATFTDIVSSLSERADKINVNATLTAYRVYMTQEDPWRIKIVLEGNLYIVDKGGLASWNKTSNFSGYIPIENFEDPFYTINTHGKLINKINRTLYSNFVSGVDISNLSSHLNNHYYLSSNLAPSFINRIEGNYSASPLGIESLVYLPDLTSQGILVEDKSCVDYIYFSNENPNSYSIQGMPSWLKIDSTHLNIYNVSGLTY